MSNILVEIVCCSADDCVEAEAGGANRIELCAALSEGGLTPSIGVFEQARSVCALPSMVMIRPRGGGFCYSDNEFDTMRRDIDELVERGADGLVFMILNEDGSIDLDRVRSLANHAKGQNLVCHRAFDVTPDPFESIDILVELGFSRILTSGHQGTALEGAQTIRKMLEYANNRIEILPGGGIRPNNSVQVIETTGANQIHLAPLTTFLDPTSDLGKPTTYGSHTLIKREDVAATVDALRHAKPA